MVGDALVNYQLICLTHGPTDFLHRTIASFREMVTPAPESSLLVIDRPGNDWAIAEYPQAPGRLPWAYTTLPAVGFCQATGIGWKAAAAGTSRYVFWLEHDFEFVRPINLELLAFPLDYDPSIAQVSLMRNAVNVEEHKAGGLYELRRAAYKNYGADLEIGGQRAYHSWLLHDAYFTTNPSLMTRRFMAENPWMSFVPECEGRFGIDLRERGYKFAAWGQGEPWVKHIGDRGPGHGY